MVKLVLLTSPFLCISRALRVLPILYHIPLIPQVTLRVISYFFTTMGDMNFSLTTFNKNGKLLQIEYALKRVAQGKMALGACVFFLSQVFTCNNTSV